MKTVLLTELDRFFLARAKARETLLRIANNPKHSQIARDRARYSAILLRRDGD